jgi:hypothetical protein
MTSELSPEIILNLWSVQDSQGIIYSLRARAYVALGSDEEKLSMLTTFAQTDYLIARSFPIPENFHTRINGQLLQVAHAGLLESSVPPLAIYEDAINALNNDLPAQTDLQISADPIVCLTVLLSDASGNLKPLTTHQKRL